jgi:UDP-3-O-[3-hydroxymyristoyl] glucosamine N-acyltransferase
MKIIPSKTLKQIAELLGVDFVGDDALIITGLNEIHRVEHGDIVFVDHPKYYDSALKSNASVVLINKEVSCPEGKGLLVSEDPFRDFNFLINFFSPFEFTETMRGNDVSIGSNTRIHPSVALGNRVKIGENCIIHPNVVIYDDCEIGSNVIIHAGTVLGAHAFYYKKRPSSFDRLNSCGKVVIEDHVELGAMCTVDKGVTAITRIGKGTKMDNHVHIGHDTQIGEMCLFAAQVGIAGCVVIEDGVTLWGQVGVPSNIVIGKGAVVLGQSGISKSLEGNITYFGSPAEDARKKMKELVLLRKIPMFIEQLEKMTKS